jgi:hypothetical protein
MSASRPEHGRPLTGYVPAVPGSFWEGGSGAPALVIPTILAAGGLVALCAATGAAVHLAAIAFAVSVAGLAFAVLLRPGSTTGAECAALVALTGAVLALAADTTRSAGVVLAVLGTGWIAGQMYRRA